MESHSSLWFCFVFLLMISDECISCTYLLFSLVGLYVCSDLIFHLMLLSNWGFRDIREEGLFSMHFRSAENLKPLT